MRIVFTILGVLLGAASVASLIQRLFDVGLAPITQDVLDYYRWFMTEVVRVWVFDWWTLRWFDFRMPQWTLDLLAIYLLGAGSTGRAIGLPRNLDGSVSIILVPNFLIECLFWPFHLPRVFFSLVAGTNPAGNTRIEAMHTILKTDFVGVGPEFVEERVKRIIWHEWRALFHFAADLLVTPLAAAAFFVWNAIQLSP